MSGYGVSAARMGDPDVGLASLVGLFACCTHCPRGVRLDDWLDQCNI